jgi:hypothetical protein
MFAHRVCVANRAAWIGFDWIFQTIHHRLLFFLDAIQLFYALQQTQRSFAARMWLGPDQPSLDQDDNVIAINRHRIKVT